MCLAHPAGVEPTAYRLGGGRSILLSYGCISSSWQIPSMEQRVVYHGLLLFSTLAAHSPPAPNFFRRFHYRNKEWHLYRNNIPARSKEKNRLSYKALILSLFRIAPLVPLPTTRFLSPFSFSNSISSFPHNLHCYCKISALLLGIFSTKKFFYIFTYKTG